MVFVIVRVPDITVLPETSMFPLISKSPPTFKFLPIPTPPVTTSAPLDVLVDCWELVILVIPDTPNVLFN